MDDLTLLRDLVALWAQTRSPEAAGAIELLSSAMPVPPVEGRTKAEKEREWLALAERRDPASLATLLAAPWPAKWREASARTQALRGWLDPRIATAMIAVLEARPYRAGPSIDFYRRLLEVLTELRDVRQLEPLRRAGAALLSAFPDWVYLSDFRNGAQGKTLEEALRLAPPEPPPADDPLLARAWSRLAGMDSPNAARERDERDFLERIWADPGSEELRRVYADWLLEHGDVRGEFINLQCERAAGRGTPAALRREEQILREHRARLLGPLAPYVGDASAFERGFLGRAATATELLECAIAAPEWATVTSLLLPEQGDARVLARFLAGPGRFVSGLHNLRLDRVQELQALAPEVRIEELSLRLWKAEPLTLRWPRLRRLAIIRPRLFFAVDRRVGGWEDLIGEALWRRLTSFACNDSWEDYRDWLARFRRMEWLTSVRVLSLESESVLEPEGFETRFEREAPGGAIRLAVHGHAGYRDLAALQSGLGALPRELRSTLTAQASPPLNAAERRVLEELRSEE